jgi:hypothetical protein
VPVLPRLVAQLVLLVVRLVIGIVVGFVTPLVLGILSLIFGAALRRAAQACYAAAMKGQAGVGRASSWLGGARAPELPPDRLRVPAEAQAVRIADLGGEDGEAWIEERLAEDEARMGSDAHRLRQR